MMATRASGLVQCSHTMASLEVMGVDAAGFTPGCVRLWVPQTATTVVVQVNGHDFSRKPAYRCMWISVRTVALHSSYLCTRYISQGYCLVDSPMLVGAMNETVLS